MYIYIHMIYDEVYDDEVYDDEDCMTKYMMMKHMMMKYMMVTVVEVTAISTMMALLIMIATSPRHRILARALFPQSRHTWFPSASHKCARFGNRYPNCKLQAFKQMNLQLEHKHNSNEIQRKFNF